jgi:hypothetical protein
MGWVMLELHTALSRLDEAKWHQSATPDGPVKWLPLWLFGDTGLWLGLDEQARWIVGRPGRMVVQGAPPLSPGWLPMLDHDELTAREELTFSADKYGLPAALILESLPIDDVIALALKSDSAHWTERALMWLEARSVRDDIREMLPAVVSSKAAGQRARQIAKRLVKRAEASLVGR